MTQYIGCYKSFLGRIKPSLIFGINLNDSIYWEWFNGIPFGSVNHPIFVVLNDSLGLPSESQFSGSNTHRVYTVIAF